MVTVLTLPEILKDFSNKALSERSDAELAQAQVNIDQLMRSMNECGITEFPMAEAVTMAKLVEVGDMIENILNTRYGCDD